MRLRALPGAPPPQPEGQSDDEPLRPHRQGRRRDRIEPRHRPCRSNRRDSGPRSWCRAGRSACEPVVDFIRAEAVKRRRSPTSPCKPEVETLVAKTSEVFGPADILVCNAAVNPVYGPLERPQRRSVRQGHGLERQEQSLALRLVIGMAARRRRRGDRLVDRRPSRHGDDRRLRVSRRRISPSPATSPWNGVRGTCG